MVIFFLKLFSIFFTLGRTIQKVTGVPGVLGIPWALRLPGVLEVIGVLGTGTGYHFCIIPSRYIKENIVLK